MDIGQSDSFSESSRSVVHNQNISRRVVGVITFSSEPGVRNDTG